MGTLKLAANQAVILLSGNPQNLDFYLWGPQQLPLGPPSMRTETVGSTGNLLTVPPLAAAHANRVGLQEPHLSKQCLGWSQLTENGTAEEPRVAERQN